MRTSTRRVGSFIYGLAGMLIGAMLITALPAVGGTGDNMVLGASNKSGRSTWLSSRGPSVLKLNNTAGGVALDLRVAPGTAPLAVNSTTGVPNLNADMLDGRHGAFFRNANNISAGVLDDDRFDAYGNLLVRGALDDNSHWDLLTRSQADNRYLSRTPDTYLYVPGNTLEQYYPDYDFDVLRFGWGGAIVRPTAVPLQDPTVLIPIPLPANQGGQWIRLVDYRVYYEVDHAINYITETRLLKMDAATLGRIVLDEDSTDRNSTTPTSYVRTCAAADCVLSWPSGGFLTLELELGINDVGLARDIRIGGVLLRYSYD